MYRTALGRRLLAVTLLLGIAAAARSEDIATVLTRSQSQRLATLESVPADLPAALVLQRDFDELIAAAPVGHAVRLHVASAGTVAETLLGEVVVVNVALAEWPKVARQFVIAHELGHVRESHWDERILLYRSFVPGEVNPAATDAVAGPLGQAASQQSHQHEHDADEMAMNLMLDLGHTEDELFQLLVRFGNHRATATHPSMQQRISHLRTLVEQRSVASAARWDALQSDGRTATATTPLAPPGAAGRSSPGDCGTCSALTRIDG